MDTLTNPYTAAAAAHGLGGVVHGICRHCSRRTFLGRKMRYCAKCVAKMRSVVVALLYPGLVA